MTVNPGLVYLLCVLGLLLLLVIGLGMWALAAAVRELIGVLGVLSVSPWPGGAATGRKTVKEGEIA